MHHEISDATNDFAQRPGIESNVVYECAPLLLLLFLGREVWSKRVRQVRRYFSSAPRECGGDRASQSVVVEGERLAEQPNIVEVFHSAIRTAQNNHCLELLCDHRFPSVGAQPRSRQIEHGRIIDKLGAWLQHISEPDVDNDRDSRTADRRCRAQP